MQEIESRVRSAKDQAHHPLLMMSIFAELERKRLVGLVDKLLDNFTLRAEHVENGVWNPATEMDSMKAQGNLRACFQSQNLVDHIRAVKRQLSKFLTEIDNVADIMFSECSAEQCSENIDFQMKQRIRDIMIEYDDKIDQISRYGDSSEVCATLSIEPPRTEQAMEKAIRGLVDGRYLWIVFTSPHAVEAIIERLAETGLDSRALSGVLIAAVGRGTVEALARHGLLADLVPVGENTAEGLSVEFPAHDDLIDPLDRVLVPSADVSVASLVEGLERLGWEAEEVTAYRTVRAAPPPAEIRERIKDGMFDAAVFTSSTAVRNMIGIAGKPHAATIVAAIGPATAAACEMHGLRVDIVADAPTFESVAEGLAGFADLRRAERAEQGLPESKPSERKRRRRRKAPADRT